MSGSINDDASEITIEMQKQAENEMSSISSEEMFDDDGHFVPKRLGDAIKNLFHFKTTSDNSVIYVYDNGVYRPDGEVLIKGLVNSVLGEKYSRFRLAETISVIQTSTFVKRNSPDTNLINLTNGFYNISTGNMEDHDPEIFSISQMPFSYEKGMDCPAIKKFISEVVREGDTNVIQEMFGYCLLRDYHIQKAFMFLGEGNNGKSTLLNLLTAFLGKDNVCSVGLQELEKRFTAANLYGKLANIYPDLPDAALKFTGKFKMLTGGDNISAEQKFKEFFNFTNHAKLIFSANKLPETNDDTSAFYRRWEFVSFPNRFEGDSRDLKMIDKLTTDSEMSGLFNWAIAGLKRMLDNHGLSSSVSTEETRDLYIRLSSPVAAFVKDRLEFNSEGSITKEEMYREYVIYCNNNSLPTVASNTFAMKLMQNFPNISTSKKTKEGTRKACWTGVRWCPGSP